jgi:hypothetical protein
MKIEPLTIVSARHPAMSRMGKTRSIATGYFLSGFRISEHAGKHHGSTPLLIDNGKSFFGLVRPHAD